MPLARSVNGHTSFIKICACHVCGLLRITPRSPPVMPVCWMQVSEELTFNQGAAVYNKCVDTILKSRNVQRVAPRLKILEVWMAPREPLTHKIQDLIPRACLHPYSCEVKLGRAKSAGFHTKALMSYTLSGADLRPRALRRGLRLPNRRERSERKGAFSRENEGVEN